MKHLYLFLLPLILMSCQAGRQGTPGTVRFYTGTSDGSLEHSIILCQLDRSDGQLAVTDSFSGARSPSYLALSPDRKHLYAVNEVNTSEESSQKVTAFSVDRRSGRLEFLNSQPSEGAGPCYISVHPGGKFIFTANYTSGSIAVHPINDDGSLAPACDVKQHEGSGPDTTRQLSAHAHFIHADPQGRFVLAVDLGMDKVMIYSFDAGTGILTPNPAQESFGTQPGAGPRHIAFHPDGRRLYLLNELNGTLTACNYDPEKGMISWVSTLPALGADFSGYNKSAAVRVHPGGKFVYASNRGDRNSISVFRVEETLGLRPVQVQDRDINFPRDFNIDPSGEYLLAENQYGNSIVVFTIDPATGMLNGTGNTLPVSQPTCIVFLDE